jgi:5'-3' exonuclease
MAWWKFRHPDEPLSDPFQSEIFIEKYKKLFLESLKNLQKNLQIDKQVNPILFVGKDCKRENIWRNALFKDYKSNRLNGPEDGFMGGPFFKMAYEDENLFQQGGAKLVLKHPNLEADDCIAISVKEIIQLYPECKIYIITSDKDYLQLAEERIQIFDLKFKDLTKQKSSFGDSSKDLFCKIVMGDPSDCIPSVIKKCGPKTAEKCYENRDYFEDRLKKENAYEIFERNKNLVGFEYIPEFYAKEFINDNLSEMVAYVSQV